MADELGIPGSGSCIRCRGTMPIDSILCPTCCPTSPEPVNLSVPSGAQPAAPAPAKPQESLVNSPFIVALAFVIMFLFLASYNPRQLEKERGEPMSMKSQWMGREAEDLKTWSEDMRRDYVDAYGGYPPIGVSPEQLRAVLEMQLEMIDRDPHLTKEQRRQVRLQIDNALGASGR